MRTPLSHLSFIRTCGLAVGLILAVLETALSAAPPTVRVQVPAAGDPADAPNTFLLTRDGPTDEPLDVEYEIGGNAVNGVDYLRLAHRATIPAGQISTLLRITPLRAGLGENARMVTVKLLAPARPFALVVLPDTQCYTAQISNGKIEMLTAQIRWILARQAELNIAFVLHEGDCTNNNTLAEWQRFKSSMSELDGQVPYAIALGNHDGMSTKANSTAYYQRFFPLSEQRRRPEFVEAFEAGLMDNCAYFFNAGGIDWLIFALEMGPRDEVLAWANRVSAAHPNRRIIMVTHAHVYSDNTLHGNSAGHSLTPTGSFGRANNGPAVWDKFLRRQPGSALAFNGHISGYGRLSLVNDAGNRVYQMLSDYQSMALGGGGLLRIVQFDPAQDKMSVSTYSPYNDTWLRDAGNQFEYSNLGMFTGRPEGYRIDAAQGQASLTLRPNAGAFLSNLSVRSNAGAGGQTLIVGFVVGGSGAKQVLIRGVGPTLTDVGVAGALADPQLGLFAPDGTAFNRNDDWGGGATLRDAFASVGAFALPAASRDAALLDRLVPAAYTAQVTGAANTSGVALVEAYDIDAPPATARLSNVSARSQVGTGDSILIAGFIIGGTATKNLLIRGIGPGLRDLLPAYFTASEVLADPKLRIVSAAGVTVAENDNWPTSLAAPAREVRAFALTTGSLDAALTVTLPPGAYTAQLSGVNNGTGIALIEIYDLDL